MEACPVAVTGLVLNFVPHKQRALEKLRRFVKPGSTVASYVRDYAGEMQLMRCFWKAVADMFSGDVEHDAGTQFPICNPEALADFFEAAELGAIEICAIDTPTVFVDFDDYWPPFLSGQGPAGGYCVSLSETDRDRPRGRLEDMLPFNADGTIELIWAVRGTA